MANFKAALEALAIGKLKHESLSKQLDSVLKSSPNFINKMLSELDEVYGQKKLDDKQYSVLKDQITKFMRAHVLKANKNKKSDIQKQDNTQKTEAPKPQHEIDRSLDATVIGGEEKTFIGAEEKTAIESQE